MSAEIPHFTLPLRLAGEVLAVSEQDALDEVTACVEAIIRTPLGWRDELPNFGIEEQALRENGPDLPGIRRAVERFEPRAELVLDEEPAVFGEILVRAGVKVPIRPEAA